MLGFFPVSNNIYIIYRRNWSSLQMEQNPLAYEMIKYSSVPEQRIQSLNFICQLVKLIDI